MPFIAGMRVLPAVAVLLSAGVTSAFAGDGEPETGLPESSIAANLPYDAARASLAARGLTYGLNYTGEVL